MSKRLRARRGFTLVEILLVLTIIGLMAGIAIFAIVGQREGAKKDITMGTIKSVENALDTYNLNIGHYPSEEEGGMGALMTKPTFENEAMGEKWRGPYLKQEALDAWGNKLNYQLQQAGTAEAQQYPYRLWSNGPDGMDGTEDDIKNYSDETTPR